MLNCAEHAHCRPDEAQTRLDKRTAERISNRVICLRPQAHTDNSPWQKAHGWAPRPSDRYMVMQLLTDRSYRLAQ